MISIWTLILANVIVTILAVRSIKNQSGAEKFLFIPHAVASGNNLQGAFLSHFSHAGSGHLIFNMISFFFFAPVIIGKLSDIGLWIIYIAAGIGADLFTFIIRRNDPSYRCLGASGSVAGVIFAAIVLDPSISISLFFIPIFIPGPIFAVLYLALSIYLMKQEGGGISHEAHIGGAVVGFLTAALLSKDGLSPLLERILGFF